MDEFMIGSVQRTELLPREEREHALQRAGYNVFNLDSDEVFIDMLTDSGTGAMSREQWAAVMKGDESYAGSSSFRRLEDAVEEVMGFEQVIPCHQGRGAENVLYGALVDEGDHVPNNTHFDTTRAHVAANGARPVDCPVDGALDADADGEFKGNIDPEKVRELADEVGKENIPAIIMTLTNNSMAGQPVSMDNIEEARDLADELDATFVIDACRYVDNAYFIKQREDGYSDVSVAAIAKEQLSHADAVVMSGKKNGLANVGGFVAVRDEQLFQAARERGILYEGFTTYGGMSGRAMEAMAVGLRQYVDEPVVASRVEQVRKLGEMMEDRGIPVYTPFGGHAVYIDAAAMLPHIDQERFPGQALVTELYREGGVRAVELGSFAFPGETERPELVRLCVPIWRYHHEHLEHVADTAEKVLERRDAVSGLRITEEPDNDELRHFMAGLEPVDG